MTANSLNGFGSGPRSIMLLPSIRWNQRKDQCCAQRAISRARIVAQARLLRKAEAARHGGAAQVALVTANGDAVGVQFRETEVCDHPGSFRHIAMPLG